MLDSRINYKDSAVDQYSFLMREAMHNVDQHTLHHEHIRYYLRVGSAAQSWLTRNMINQIYGNVP